MWTVNFFISLHNTTESTYRQHTRQLTFVLEGAGLSVLLLESMWTARQKWSFFFLSEDKDHLLRFVWSPVCAPLWRKTGWDTSVVSKMGIREGPPVWHSERQFRWQTKTLFRQRVVSVSYRLSAKRASVGDGLTETSTSTDGMPNFESFGWRSHNAAIQV